jgi:hypothetical protein
MYWTVYSLNNLTSKRYETNNCAIDDAKNFANSFSRLWQCRIWIAFP